MRIGQADRLWVVTDPTPVSTLGDVCFQVSLRELEHQFRGGLSCEDGLTLFSDREEAEAEAQSRLLTRDTAKALGEGMALARQAASRIAEPVSASAGFHLR